MRKAYEQELTQWNSTEYLMNIWLQLLFENNDAIWIYRWICVITDENWLNQIVK